MSHCYNHIFSTLVQDDDDFVGMVAYTLYKRQKIEWIAQFKQNHGDSDPTPQELEDGFGKFSNMPSQIAAYRDQAIDLLDAFLDAALGEQVLDARERAKDEAIVKAVKKGWVAGVTENLVAGLISSVITLGAAGLFWVAAKGPENLMREALKSLGVVKQIDQNQEQLPAPSSPQK